MNERLTQLVGNAATSVGDFLPHLVGALVLLILGWIAAAIIASAGRAAVRRTRLGQRYASWHGGEETVDAAAFERWTGKGLFALVMLFVLVGFFQTLGLSQISQPIIRFLNEVFAYAPRLIGPALLVVSAWIVARLLRFLTQRGLAAVKFDKRVGDATEADGQMLPLTQTIGETVYWLTFLLFLPAILSALDLGGLLEPVQGMIDKVLAYLPNLLAAGVILVLGWIVARILRRIVTNLLVAMGVERLSRRVGIDKALGEQQLSPLIGLLVFVLVLIPVLIGALNALELEAITRPASDMLNEVLTAIPNVFAAALVLIVAFVVGRVVTNLVTNLLTGVGFNNVPTRLGLTAGMGDRTLSEIVGYLILVTVMLFAGVEALRLIEFEALAELVSVFLFFAGDIALAIVIVGLGLYVANIAAQAVRTAGPPQAELLALAARIGIIILAIAMGLGHMGVATDIINIAFGIMLAAIAVAFALAFGIGSRDLAGRVASDWLEPLLARKSSPPARRSAPKDGDDSTQGND